MKRYLLVLLAVTFTTCLLVGCGRTEKIPKKTGFVPVAGNDTIYYESTGQGEAILLLHAGFQDHKMWQEQVDSFSRRYQVITIDLPGHGKSKGDSSVLIADVLRTVLDSLHVDKAAVAGVSIGGTSAIDFALDYPKRVSKLILVSSGLSGWEDPTKPDSTKSFLSQFYHALQSKDTTQAAEVFTHYWFDGPIRTARQVDPAERSQVYSTTLTSLLQHRQQGWPLFSKPVASSRLANIQVPTLVFTGDKDMEEVKRENAFMIRTIPNVHQVIVPNAAHMINIEQPDYFDKELKQFLLDQ